MVKGDIGGGDAGSYSSGAYDSKIGIFTEVTIFVAAVDVGYGGTAAIVVDGGTVSRLGSTLRERLDDIGRSGTTRQRRSRMTSQIFASIVQGMKSKLGFPKNPHDGVGSSSSFLVLSIANVLSLKREPNDRPLVPPSTRSGELKSDPGVVSPDAPAIGIVRTPGVFVVDDLFTALVVFPSVFYPFGFVNTVGLWVSVHSRDRDVHSGWFPLTKMRDLKVRLGAGRCYAGGAGN